MTGGRAGGMWTAAGVVLGQVIWTLAASLGLAGIVSTSQPIFNVIKFAGAAYLTYLGLQSLRAALRRRPVLAHTHHPAVRMSPRNALSQGLINNLANPKMAAFFVSLLPQFVPAEGVSLPVLLSLGLLFSLLTFVWLAAYSVVAARFHRVLARTRVRCAIDSIAGGVLLAFGVRLAWSSQP